MSDAPIPDSQPGAEAGESFDQILSQFEQSHSRPSDNGGRQLEGTVIVVSRESVFLDIGYKSEGILPLAEFESAGEKVKPGDRMMVSVKGRDPEGYYELSRSKIERPRDWPALERLFA
jgi:small subunit ribosomal protein S1